MEQLGSHWTDSHEILHWRDFRKSVEEIQVSLKSEKNNWYFTWRRFQLCDSIAKFFLDWDMFPIKVVEKIKIHILCSTAFSENRVVYEIMSQNTVEPEKPQMTIWRVSVACWISKATPAQAHFQPLRTHTHTRTRPLTHRNVLYLLLFHSNNGYVNAPQCYVVRTLAVSFRLYTWQSELQSEFPVWESVVVRV